MIRPVLLRAVVLTLVVTSSRFAVADFGHEWFHGIHIPNCIRKCCCDDYHPKPLPPVCGVKKFCCDDYCHKPLPCPVKVKRFCCDDYCHKRFPWIFCPPCSDLKCPLPLPRCGTGPCAAHARPVPIVDEGLPLEKMPTLEKVSPSDKAPRLEKVPVPPLEKRPDVD